MKKLFLLVSLMVISGMQALGKKDLEQAIRTLDKAAVKQIMATEKFTPYEYNCYLDLAGQVVHMRKIWMLTRPLCEDVSTPYEGPSRDRLFAEFFAGYALTVFSGLFLFPYEEVDFKNNPNPTAFIGLATGLSLLAKFVYDYKKARRMTWEHAELLREKYEDAVSIQHLISMAAVAG